MIGFVILHYLTEDETKKCVRSIQENVHGQKIILVVDNHSPNASGQRLSACYETDPEVTVLLSDSNSGFANGNNLGYQYLVEHYQPDFICVMNNDMEILSPDFYEKVYRSYDQYHYAILGPDVYSTKGCYHQNPQTRTVPTKEQLKKNYRILNIKYHLPILISAKWFFKQLRKQTETPHRDANFVQEVVINPLLHGSCYIFSRQFIDKHPHACFYEKTFMYLEAEILHYQAMRDHALMIYDPEIQVAHHEDVSTNARFTKQVEKSKFSVKCLRQSTAAFLELLEKDS